MSRSTAQGRRLISFTGYRAQAIRLLHTRIVIDALMTDIRIPEANSREVARAYREGVPDLPVLSATGYAEQMHPVPKGIIISNPIGRPK